MNDNIGLYNIVTIQNVHSKPIDVIYNNTNYGTIQPGEIKRLPEFLARHTTKHLINQILNTLKIPVNNMTEREKWASKIVVEKEDSGQPTKIESKEEMIRRQISELNAQLEEAKNDSPKSDLDNVLSKHAPKVKDDPQVDTPEETPIDGNETKEEVPEGIDPDIVEAEAKEETPEMSSNTKLNPDGDAERQKVLDFLRNDMQMNLDDEDTMKALAKMTTNELKSEFNYEDLKTN